MLGLGLVRRRLSRLPASSRLSSSSSDGGPTTPFVWPKPRSPLHLLQQKQQQQIPGFVDSEGRRVTHPIDDNPSHKTLLARYPSPPKQAALQQQQQPPLQASPSSSTTSSSKDVDLPLQTLTPLNLTLLLSPSPTPKHVVNLLNQYVVGQTAAKKTLSTSLCDHLNLLRSIVKGECLPASNNPQFSPPSYKSPHVLLIGPSGVGKSHLIHVGAA